jgi:hypothetical protein
MWLKALIIIAGARQKNKKYQSGLQMSLRRRAIRLIALVAERRRIAPSRTSN